MAGKSREMERVSGYFHVTLERDCEKEIFPCCIDR